jgi:hypothetical protein
MNLTGLVFYVFPIPKQKLNRIVIIILLSGCSVFIYPKIALGESFLQPNIDKSALPEDTAIAYFSPEPLSPEKVMDLSTSLTTSTIEEEKNSNETSDSSQEFLINEESAFNATPKKKNSFSLSLIIRK